jgi:hypothetical protein
MTPIAEMVERMLAAKVAPEMIALAVATCEQMRVAKPQKQDNPKASRLSSDFVFPPRWVGTATGMGLTHDEVSQQAFRFKDYWIARPGKDGCKLDWEATWRNWCRSFLERLGRTKTNEEPSNGGWKPGLPTSEELRAKHAKQGTKVGEATPVAQDGLRSRDDQQGVVGSSPRKPGMGSLGNILRANGMDAKSLARKHENAGAHGGYHAVSVAGVATGDPRDIEEGTV